ncbi:MAG TPA: lipocalin-like domain-containing protein [Myxococcales bacterium]
MRTIIRAALPVLATLAFVAFAARGAGTQKMGKLKQQLVGAWTMVSDTVDQGGAKVEPFGPSPKGNMILTSDGHFSIVLTRPDVPKFASNSRTNGTADENKAAMQGGIGYFGTYTVSDADKTVNLRVEASTFPNWSGTDQKRIVALSGDEMTVTNPTPSIGPGTATLVWKRAKGTRQTAQR